MNFRYTLGTYVKERNLTQSALIQIGNFSIGWMFLPYQKD